MNEGFVFKVDLLLFTFQEQVAVALIASRLCEKMINKVQDNEIKEDFCKTAE